MEEGRQNEVTQNEELFCKQLLKSVAAAAAAAQGRVGGWQVVGRCCQAGCGLLPAVSTSRGQVSGEPALT